MKKIQISRLRDARMDMNLSTTYVSKLMGISLDQFHELESGRSDINDGQITRLAIIYGYPKAFFYEQEVVKANVLTRNGDEISEFDKHQIADFLAFQKEISLQKQKQ